MKRIPPLANHDTDVFPLGGGLDQVTPRFSVPPGMARNAQNFECAVDGGYTMSQGYERFDGRAKPSSALHNQLNATITGSFSVGNTLTGATSGATGKIIASTATSFILTRVSGTFQVGENLNVGGPTIAVATTAQIVGGADTPELAAQYKNLAADDYRADIQKVPGSGPVRGVVQYNGTVYAFRNNAGGTACDLYRSTAGGWVQVTLTKEISFTAGSGNIADGQTLTKGGTTATIQRVVVQSGSLGAGTAAGRLIITSVASGPFTAGAATTSGGGSLTLSGAETNITLLPGGRYVFDIGNVIGGSSTKRLYGCDAVNRGFEFDGTVFVPIVTGMAQDKPKHVRVHQKHLFFGFGASLQHSGITTPYAWTAVSGAAELAMPDDITGLIVLPGSNDGAAMAVFSRNRISVLYGTGSTTWSLVTYQGEIGCFDYSAQHIGLTLFLDDIGITMLQASQVYGNFEHAAISNKIKPFINEKKTRIVDSVVVRDKNQYRLFFNDGSALYVTMKGNKVLGMIPQIYAHVVTCAWWGEGSDGTEQMFFGTSDGYVMQMDRGTSHDGEPVEYLLDLHFAGSKSLRQIKRYRKAVLDTSGSGYSKMGVAFNLGWLSDDIPQVSTRTVERALDGQDWDSGYWDQGYWDGTPLGPAEIDIEGSGENIAASFYLSSDYVNPLNISGVLFQFSRRRSLR